MHPLPRSSTTSSVDILTVTEINGRARRLLETHFNMVWVTGEISNLACPSSGHWYFTLKDADAQVRCAMFRNHNRLLRFRPENGQQVLLRGRVSLYEGRGEYQLIAEFIEAAGDGALQRTFEVLRQKLLTAGLFEAKHKQPLPELPRHIGVITSPHGAAIHDILNVCKRRFPLIPITVIPVAVQGAQAPHEICDAIELANRSNLFDVLILARGGGSLEDLQAFNTEMVARAIFASQLPIVCGVGHETDITIADFVADQRAPTPSAAAELLTPDRHAYLLRLARLRESLVTNLLDYIRLQRHELRILEKSLIHPTQTLQQQSQKLDMLEMRLQQQIKSRLMEMQYQSQRTVKSLYNLSPLKRLEQIRPQVSNLSTRLNNAALAQQEGAEQKFQHLCAMLNLLSPLATLDRGYSMTTDSKGRIIRDVSTIEIGDNIKTKVANGLLVCEVKSKET